ncbi:type IV secretion protein Rhs [Escherichia coli]|nr:type IV secretion protein Rhs [Escherichia coli]
MMSLWDALRMNMMISYQELVRTFLRDYGLNLFGMYGRKVKLSHSVMIEDNKKDLAVNDHGLTCPSTTDCSDRCSDYINPEHKKTIKALQDAGYLK